MGFKSKGMIAAALTAGVALGVAALLAAEPEYAYHPPQDKIANAESQDSIRIQSEKDPDSYSPEMIELGRKSFYGETFGNEVFFSDIMGLFDGAFTIGNIAKAIFGLAGKGTSNLQVEAAQTVEIGGRTIRKGELIDTGLDVPKGSLSPLGVKVKWEDGRMKAGISCALCHAAVDAKTGMVLQGAANTDLNVGLLLAMGTNTAAYFTHTEIRDLWMYLSEYGNRTVKGNGGKEMALPDPEKLEKAVDAQIMQWPKGSNDTTIDFENNPVQIPDSFTLGDHPYGWSGQGLIGPYKGLSAAINNAHAQNTDALSQSEMSETVLGIDKELYMATLLQNAANPIYRYDPASGKKPSAFFAAVDPTPGAPGVNQLIPAPSYPRLSFMTSTGLMKSSQGYEAWEQVNAMSAWMNTLVPPELPVKRDEEKAKLGRTVFERAGCASCHAGDSLTNHKMVSVEEIGTDPSRAKGFKRTELQFSPPTIYKENTPVPLPQKPEHEIVQAAPDDLRQLKVSWAHGESKGGYKVPSLLGLYWSAPYLHDGGVALGPQEDAQAGIPGTLGNGILPDPANSLKALLDRDLRERVIRANRASREIPAHVSGAGHAYWVDLENGYSGEEQEALIHYLLTVPAK